MKIMVSVLELEITRKCQLKCAHCMRGDAQNIDMSNEVIDRILEDVGKIEHALFTGGEPTLNIGAMRHFLEKLKISGIILNEVEIVTNGYDIPEDFVTLLKEYYEYATPYSESDKITIHLFVSNDKYHVEQGCNPEQALKRYQQIFNGYDRMELGLHTVAEEEVVSAGRATRLAEAIPKKTIASVLKKRIEVFHRDEADAVCPLFDDIDFGNCDVAIPCKLSVDVFGNLVKPEQYEYVFTSVVDDTNILKRGLIDAIESFNKDAYYCYDSLYIGSILKNSEVNQVARDVLTMIRLNNPEMLVKWLEREKGKEAIAAKATSKPFIPPEAILNNICKREGVTVQEHELKLLNAAEQVGYELMTRKDGILERKGLAEKIFADNFIDDAALRICSKIKAGEDQKTGRIDAEIHKINYTFKDIEEADTRRQHPDWTKKDVVMYSNSMKQLDALRNRKGAWKSADENMVNELIKRHEGIIADILQRNDAERRREDEIRRMGESAKRTIMEVFPWLKE